VQPVVVVAASIGGVLLLTELIKACLEWIGTAQSELIQDHITDLVHAKSASVDLAFYETPDFYDHLYRARGDASNRPLALLQSSGSLVQNCITLIAMAAVLIPYGTWLPPALLFSTLPAFYVVVRTSQRYHDWWKNTTPERRRSQYFGVVLTDGWHAGEVRLFGLAGYFQDAYGVGFTAPQGVSTEAEASAKDVAAIITQIKKQKVAAVFLENVTDPRLVQQIARETGAKVGGTLYSDALTDEKGDAPTYIDLIRHNLRQLAAALVS